MAPQEGRRGIVDSTQEASIEVVVALGDLDQGLERGVGQDQ